MRFAFISVVVFFSLTSCANINFLLDENSGTNFLKNKTSVYVSGWNNPVLKEAFFLRLGEASDNRFFLTAEVTQKQTKRSVDENQVAKKIDYKIIINYNLSDIEKNCSNISNSQTSSFSFTPKSSGYNFASDVLLKNLYEEAILSNVNSFVYFANNKLNSYKCLNED